MNFIVAAIDFGTTYSSWAFSFKHEFESNPLTISTKTWTGQTVSEKGPTCILIKENKEAHSFGFEAEDKYAELVANNTHKSWYFFRRFKMMLFDKRNLGRNDLLTDSSGKKLEAKIVFSLAIRYLKNDLLQMTQKQLGTVGIQDKDIRWVLTVPAIWDDAAKQFMREAATKAGIANENLRIALEPEAASIFCRHLKADESGKDKVSLSSFGEGKKYLILDAGGGTVDITVHEVIGKGLLKEICEPSGGEWGGTKVDEAFFEFLSTIIGSSQIMETLKETCVEEFTDLLRDLEVKKRSVGKDIEKISIIMPAGFLELVVEKAGNTLKMLIGKSKYSSQVQYTAGKMRINQATFRSFFDSSVNSIIRHVAGILQVNPVDAIVMVGGYSDSKVLQDAIHTNFSSKCKIIVPLQAELAVLKGAVIFGHRPESITERVSKYTYGTDVIEFVANTSLFGSLFGPETVNNVFSTLVSKGQVLEVGKAQKESKFFPVSPFQTMMGMDIYRTNSEIPKLVTDQGCYKVGNFIIPCKGSVTVRVIFGGTEIDVECTDDTSGEIKHLKVDFLN